MNKIGFGFLRLPGTAGGGQGSIDFELLNRMTDVFLSKGGTYFDTAYTYLDGRSETAVREAVVKRHPRPAFQIADKLPSWKVTSRQDCDTYFEEQRRRCGVEWFDVYLLHWLNKANYEISERYDEFGFLRELKEAGKAKKIGFSYHDSAALLDRILTAHPEVDIVQLQINYLDWNSPSIEAARCYEVAARHGKSIVVMEPVKGGTLAKLPAEAERIFQAVRPKGSMASWALDFVQSLEKVDVVLSGMNTMEQMLDNMREAKPVTPEEEKVIEAVREILERQTAVACTGCRYCVKECPRNIAIPDYFSMYNEYCRHPEEDWKIQPAYNQLAETNGKASSCIACRQCEEHCPQHLEISAYMKKVAQAFG